MRKSKTSKASSTEQLESSGAVDREELLRQLQAVEAGVASKGIIEHTDCIMFRKGRARTHNSEIAISARVSIPYEGCVKAKPLLAILEKLPDKKIEIKITEDKFTIRGPGKLLVVFPTENAEPFIFAKSDRPVDWKPLHPDFTKALRLAQYCAGTDEKTQYLSTFIKIGPNIIAALDNVTQFLFWAFKDDTGFSRDGLYKAEAIKHVLDIEPIEICETESWTHFRNGNDVMFSILQHEGVKKFPDLRSVTVKDGYFVKLPKALAGVAECAGELTKDNKDENFVQIRLISGKPKGRIIVKGESEMGKFRRVIPKVKYKGPSIVFALSAKLLREIVTSYQKCELTNDKIQVSDGRFTYVACLHEVRSDEEGSDE